MTSTSDLYDFNDTLARLEDIGRWLKSLGLPTHHRVSVYTQNISRMMEVQASGEMEALQDSIAIEKAREIYWSYIDADEFVRAVSALRERCGDTILLAPIDRALNGPADFALENTNNNDGRNFMFELIMAGRFATAGFLPSFDKGPDVHFDFAGLEVAVQCKRPFSVRKLEHNIGKAIRQLRDGTAGLNLIAVSASRLLCAGDPFGIPQVADRKSGHPYLRARLGEMAEHTRRFWRDKLERAGILFYAFAPMRCPVRPNYFFERAEVISPVSGTEPTPTLLKCLVKGMKA